MIKKKNTNVPADLHKHLNLFDNIRNGIVIVDLQGTIIYTNHYAKKIFGIKPKQDITGHNAYNFFLPEYRSIAKKNFKLLLKAKPEEHAKFQKLIYKVKNIHGTAFWIETDSFIVHYKNRNAILVSFIDITNRKNYEMLYNESEQLFRSVVDNSHDGILLLNKNHQIVYVNTQMCLILQKKPSELIGISILDIFHDESKKFFKKNIIDNTNNSSTLQRILYTVMNKSGEKRLVELSCAIISNNNEDSIIVIQMLDITERKMMEEDLLNIKKLESVGVLAGGIAHDFNNILNAVLGNLSLLKMNIVGCQENESLIIDAERAVIRAQNLTNQLLTFSKGGAPIKKVVHIEPILKEAVKLALTGSNITYSFNLRKDLLATKIDEGQFHQVINNLVLNAKQAMPAGGNLIIRSSNKTVTANSKHNLKPGKYIAIELSDTGQGISKNNIEKIFDPYFSTKENGQGLGLTSAYAIINKHNGLITVESKEGAGTAFTILLPATTKKVKNSTQQSNKIKPGSRQGHILFMDDEEMVRSVAKKMLERIGYTVLCVHDGDEAIRQYNYNLKRGDPFDVVIMDLTIPGGMGGQEAILELKKISPNIKAIVSSGYSNDPVMANYKKYGFSEVISKPFKIEELNYVLQKVIDIN